MLNAAKMVSLSGPPLEGISLPCPRICRHEFSKCDMVHFFCVSASVADANDLGYSKWIILEVAAAKFRQGGKYGSRAGKTGFQSCFG
jgi:hypothetical protein